MRLYEKLRPQNLNDIVGQKHILKESIVNNLISTNSSLLLYGPPGVGKTTFAKIYAKKLGGQYHELSSIFTSTAELKEIFKKAQEQTLLQQKCVIFVDEIHRFNKNQQDLFLPVIENGSIILIACTTENPSFSLNNALISRCQTLQFKALEKNDFLELLENVQEKQGNLNISTQQLEMIIKNSHNDGRIFISNLEQVYSLNEINDENIAQILQTAPFKADKKGDTHYAYFSAFQKSIRGSDESAAMLYFIKMVENGEDVLSIARRMLVIACEDIGLADPNALLQVQAAIEGFKAVGQPEGLIIMAQAVNYLALAPKSNASYMSLHKVKDYIQQNPEIFPPKNILNATTKLQKEQGYKKGYIYDHDCEHSFSGQNFFPENKPRQQFYQPKNIGFERDLTKRLDFFNQRRK